IRRYIHPKRLVSGFCKARPRISDTIPKDTRVAYQFAKMRETTITNMSRKVKKLTRLLKLYALARSLIRLIKMFLKRRLRSMTIEINIDPSTNFWNKGTYSCSTGSERYSRR